MTVTREPSILDYVIHVYIARTSIWAQDMPIVFPRSHITSENSIMNSACRHVLSTTKPNTVIPAWLVSKYVTENTT
jgi:hypothetical protein